MLHRTLHVSESPTDRWFPARIRAFDAHPTSRVFRTRADARVAHTPSGLRRSVSEDLGPSGVDSPLRRGLWPNSEDIKPRGCAIDVTERPDDGFEPGPADESGLTPQAGETCKGIGTAMVPDARARNRLDRGVECHLRCCPAWRDLLTRDECVSALPGAMLVPAEGTTAATSAAVGARRTPSPA